MATKDGLFYRTPSCSVQVFTFCCFTIHECHSSIFFQTMYYTDNATSFLKMTKKVYIDEHLYWYTLVMIWQTVFVTFVQVIVPAIWHCWYLEQAEYTLDWHPAHVFLWRPVEWPCWSMGIHETDLQIPFINTYAFSLMIPTHHFGSYKQPTYCSGSHCARVTADLSAASGGTMFL